MGDIDVTSMKSERKHDGSKGDSRWKKGLSAAGSSLSSSGQSMIEDARYEAASRIHDVSYARGGKVRKTGRATVHRGERVIPRSKVKKVERLMKRSKMRMKTRR